MTTTKGYSALEVALTKLEPEPFSLIWRWFRQTWLSLQDKPYDANDYECRHAVSDVLANLALPVPKEQLAVEFRIKGLSRVGLAQITRGRVGHAYVVESQMPQHIRHETVVPLSITKHPEFAFRTRQLAAMAEALYNDMYEAGVPPQDCRYLTLHGQTTSLVWGTNYAALLGFFTMRAENGLTDELNMVCRLARKAIVDYATEHSNTHGDWLRLAEALDCLGARQRKCLNVDKVFGNTGRFVSGSDRVPSPDKLAKLQPDYDFRKSAWYLELIQLYETGQHDLLFEGEAEMLERWLAGGPLTED